MPTAKEENRPDRTNWFLESQKATDGTVTSPCKWTGVRLEGRALPTPGGASRDWGQWVWVPP